MQHVHDPAIIREDGTYYVFSTNGGIHVRRSRDLARWEYVGRNQQDMLIRGVRPNRP